MPSRPDPLLDERFDELGAQIRESRPRASAELRLRMRDITRMEPAPRRPRLAWRPRLVPALVALALLGAVFGGVVLSGGERAQRESVDGGAAEGSAAATAPAEAGAERAMPVPEAAPELAESLQADDAAVPPPSGTRLQDYDAELTVRVRDVDELSDATAQAMATARRLGGFVVSARYERPTGDEGDSFLVVRVPVTKVQQALAAYADLGTIVAQNVRIQDVQPSFNRLFERIADNERRIRELGRDLARPGLSEDERLVLRARLDAARAELRALNDQRASTLREARLARISLTLTTRGEGGRAAPPGDAERTLRDALGAVKTVAVWMLAALIVAAPFVAVGVLAALAVRRLRRRSAERLLERVGG
jgi:hypothetical protein